jgi:hypothetical protein
MRFVAGGGAGRARAQRRARARRRAAATADQSMEQSARQQACNRSILDQRFDRSENSDLSFAELHAAASQQPAGPHARARLAAAPAAARAAAAASVVGHKLPYSDLSHCASAD